MPNVSRGRVDARFKRTWSSRWKRFAEWVKRLLLYGRLDWRKASDDAKPPRLTAAERAAYEPRFEIQAIKPRNVSAADLQPEPAPAPPPAPTPGVAPTSGLPIDPALLAAALTAVQQTSGTGGNTALDPAQVAAALEAIQAVGLGAAPAAPATPEATGVRSAEALRESERDHARRYKRRRRNRSSRARVNPLTAFDSDNLPPSPLEAKVGKWFKK